MSGRRQLISVFGPSSRRWVISTGVAAFLLIIAMSMLRLTRWLSPSDFIIRGVDRGSLAHTVEWMRGTSLWFADTDDDSGEVCAYTTDGELLRVGADGAVRWIERLTGEASGVRGLLAASNSIFTVTATTVHAYDAATGNQLWSTRLGDGHVGVNLQADDSRLRVYYGTRILELARDSGAILLDEAAGDTIWIDGNIGIHWGPPGGAATMLGINRTTGERLWASTGKPFLREERFQITRVHDALLVSLSGGQICSLLLTSGDYRWCSRVEYISNAAVDASRNVAYALTREFALTRISLTAGETQIESQFLPEVLAEELHNREYRYTVAVARGPVVVSFGDSAQTFAVDVE